MQSYSLDEFATGAWSDREEYESDDPAFSHIRGLHQAKSDFVQFGRCGETDLWFFLHMGGDVAFEFYLYRAGAWSDEKGDDPLSAEPVIWIYGTTFDGVRECSGGQNFTGDLCSMADALRWVHKFCCDRWSAFDDWYK